MSAMRPTLGRDGKDDAHAGSRRIPDRGGQRAGSTPAAWRAGAGRPAGGADLLRRRRRGGGRAGRPSPRRTRTPRRQKADSATGAATGTGPLRLGLEGVGRRRDGHRLPAGAGDGVDLGRRRGVGVRGLARLRRPALGGRRCGDRSAARARRGWSGRATAGDVAAACGVVSGVLTTCGARRRTASCPLDLRGAAQPGQVEDQHGDREQGGPPGQDADDGERGDDDQQRQ